MSKELATTADTGVSVEKLSAYLDSMGLTAKLNEQEKTQFIEIAKAFNLNPFQREIYGIKYGKDSPFQIVVGYEVYLKRAERSGQFDGVDTDFYTEGSDIVCQVTVYRKDWSRPLVHRVFLSEYNSSSNPLWKSKPKTMLRKVAVSQAYRMAFPCELGGMPYTGDEVNDVQESTYETVPEPVRGTALPDDRPVKMSKLQSAEAMKALENWHKNVGSMQNDPERVANPIAYQVVLTELKSIANLDKKEMVSLFEGIKSLAYEHGVDWDAETKHFYVVPDAVEIGEEVEND